MSFRIEMYVPDLGYNLKMPHCQDMGLLEASDFVDIFKRHNPKNTYYIFNNDNGDCERQE